MNAYSREWSTARTGSRGALYNVGVEWREAWRSLQPSPEGSNCCMLIKANHVNNSPYIPCGELTSLSGSPHSDLQEYRRVARTFQSVPKDPTQLTPFSAEPLLPTVQCWASALHSQPHRLMGKGLTSKAKGVLPGSLWADSSLCVTQSPRIYKCSQLLKDMCFYIF